MIPHSRSRGVAALAAMLLALAGCSSNDASPPDDGGPTPPAATAPSITANPTSASVAVGQSLTFSVGVSGTAPLSYQWRRDGVNIAGATGATYTTPTLAMGDNGAAFSVVITNSAGTVTSTAAVITVTPPVGTTATVEVDKSASLMTSLGQSMLISAQPVDGQGAPVAGSITWESSSPAAVSVDAAGRITANALGSAMVFATANGVRSQPVFVIVAEPRPGTLMLEDSQVVAVGGPLNVAPDAPAGVGTRYEVTVTGVAPAPAPGTVVLASGDAAVAGKVVSSRSDAGNLVLTLEVGALPDMLARYDIDWHIDLSTVPVDPIEFDGTLSPSSAQSKASRKTQSAIRSRVGLFDCDGEFSANLASARATLTPLVAAHFDIKSNRLDPNDPPGYAKLALVGSQGLRGEATFSFRPRFEGEFTCIAETSLKIGATGVAGILVMPVLRIGVGFTADASFQVAEGELKLTGEAGVEETLGFECTSFGCQALKSATLKNDFKLTTTVPSLNQMKVDLNGQLFGLAGIDAALFLGLVNAEIVEARVGPRQSFELMHPDDQAKNIGMSSKYKLELAGSIGPGGSLRKAIEKFIGDENVSLNFDIPYSRPIAESPKGTLNVSSSRVAYGQPLAFQVVLDQNTLSYPFVGPSFELAYNVTEVQLWRRKATEPNFVLWQTLPAASPRSTFQHEWTPTSADTGDWEFAAFTDTALPVPIVEIADDSTRRLHVRGPGWHGNVTFTLEGSESESVPYDVGSSTGTTVRTATDTATGTFELETMPGAEGLPVMNVAQSSGTMTKTATEVTNSGGRSNGCDITDNTTQESVEQGTMTAPEGAFVVFNFLGNGTYELTIPNMFGSSTGTLHVQTSGTASGAPACQNPQPTDSTTAITGSVRTTILTVTGAGVETAATLQGNALVEFEGFPNQRYNVSWSLSR